MKKAAVVIAAAMFAGALHADLTRYIEKVDGWTWEYEIAEGKMANAQAIVVPQSNPDSGGAFAICIYVCFPQKGNFAGYCGVSPLSLWNGNSFE